MSAIPTPKEISDVRYLVSRLEQITEERLSKLETIVDTLVPKQNSLIESVFSLKSRIDEMYSDIVLSDDRITQLNKEYAQVEEEIRGLQKNIVEASAETSATVVPTLWQAEQEHTAAPIAYPIKTGIYLLEYLKACVNYGQPGAFRVGDKIYVDLNSPSIATHLPVGLTPLLARSTLRRARVTKRPLKEELEYIGWKKMPVFGVVVPWEYRGVEY